MTITARIKKNFEESGEKTAGELSELDEFKDLTILQLQNGIARVRNPEKDRDYYRIPKLLIGACVRNRNFEVVVSRPVKTH